MRSLRGALVALTGTLAAVYLIAAATMAVARPAAAAAEAAVGLAELAWLAAATRRPSRRRLGAGVALQAGIVALWLVSRTAGLPGVGRLAVGEFDVLCVLDAVASGAIAGILRGPAVAVATTTATASIGRRGRMAACQLAALLAGTTTYLAMGSMMAMAAPHTIAFGAWGHAHPGTPLFCHLL